MKRVVPGIHSVTESLKVRPKEIKRLLFRQDSLNPELQNIFDQAKKHHVAISRVSDKALSEILPSHQGVVAEVEGQPEWPTALELRGAKSGFVIAVDGVTDPHNVGSIVRTAWNFGCLGVIVTKDRAAGQTPAAEKVASGGFEHVPFLEAPNLVAELKNLKELGFWVYGLAAEGSELINSSKMGLKSVLVVGSEHDGLRKPTLGACDSVVKIPQFAGSESFNASISAAIAAYEFIRQNG